MPTKLGFKNPKHVMELAVTDNTSAAIGGPGYNWSAKLISGGDTG